MKKKEAEEFIGRIVTFGLFDKISGAKELPKDINAYVAAGNPGIVAQKYPQHMDIPETFTLGGKRCQKSDYEIRTVFGNSMLVDGIHSGWTLLLKQVEVEDVNFGDFIVINVDKDYFKHRHNLKKTLFEQKLRRAIGCISSDSTVQSIIDDLENTFAQPLDKTDIIDLTDSLKDANTFYSGDKSLFLSITYHESDIHYSFHPLSSIQYRVEGVAFNSGKEVQFRLPEEL